ncbi:MAG: hypothetical protein ACREAU_01095 [Nitrosopumilaceae archaeon]
MKTKRLIELIRLADPSGELDVAPCIHSVVRVGGGSPQHSSSSYETLVRDPIYHNVVSGRICDDTRVEINLLTLEDLLHEEGSEFPIEIAVNNKEHKKDVEEMVTRWREEAKNDVF